MKSLDLPLQSRPSQTASRQSEMRATWKKPGMQSVATKVIRIRIAYSDLDDFWDSNIVPVGPTGKTLERIVARGAAAAAGAAA